MVVVNKEEAAWIREHIPVAVVTRVNRQKSFRHRYYVSEETAVLDFLEAYRKDPAGYRKAHSTKERADF